jgi:transcriptional regulator with XRE-family HTH domain
MEKAGVNQSELGRRVGCTPAAISQILNGRTNVSRFAPDIARELGVTLDWLNGTTADPSIDKAVDVLTTEEQRLLRIYRELPKKDRAALKVLLERMAMDESAPE